MFPAVTRRTDNSCAISNLRTFARAGFENQTVSFESKREFVAGFNLPPIENLIAELDPQAIEDMKKMMKSILEEIENNGDGNMVEFGGATPRFDEGWYCP